MWSRTSHVALRIVAAIPQYPDLRLKVMKSPPPLQDPPIIQQRCSITRVCAGAICTQQVLSFLHRMVESIGTHVLPYLPMACQVCRPPGAALFLKKPCRSLRARAHTHTHTLWHSGTGLHSHIEQWVGLHFDRYDEGTPGLRSPDHAGHQPLQGTHT
jgi:hypothetical protein